MILNCGHSDAHRGVSSIAVGRKYTVSAGADVVISISNVAAGDASLTGRDAFALVRAGVTYTFLIPSTAPPQFISGVTTDPSGDSSPTAVTVTDAGACGAIGAATEFPVPYLWYSAQNIDGSNNSTLTDGQAISTWKNIGSLGSVADLAQATAGNKPAFKLVCSAGKLNNKSSVHSADTVRWMQATFPTIPLPFVASLVWASDKAGVQVIVDARSPICEFYTAAGAGGTFHAAGPQDFSSGISPGIGQFCCATFSNTEAGYALTRVNGASTGVVSSGTSGFGSVLTLFSFMGSQGAVSDIIDFRVYPGIVAAVDVEANLASYYGAFPQ